MKLTRQLRKSVKIGRNEPCSCDSGKKYKFCCLKRRSQIQVHQEGKLYGSGYNKDALWD